MVPGYGRDFSNTASPVDDVEQEIINLLAEHGAKPVADIHSYGNSG